MQLRQNQMMQNQMQNQPQMAQPMQTAAPVQSRPIDDRIWVQGEGAATAYLVAANGFARLWDSTAPIFYEKQADAYGKPLPLRIFDYTERTAAATTPSPAAPQQAQYVTIEEFNALADRLTALENKPCKCETKKAEKKVKEELADG